MTKRTRITTLPARNARINIRVQKSLLDALAELARSDNRSLSAYTETVLEAHVKAHPIRKTRR